MADASQPLMTRKGRGAAVVVAFGLVASTAAAQGAKPLKKCAMDAVVSGTVCMDRYEASVWRVPDPATTNKGLVNKIRQGKATVGKLAAGAATQIGVVGDDWAPCGDSGQNCADDVYAVSLPGVTPSRFVTWFQAQAACENARKRLPTNAEWQAAVAGTPAPGSDNGTTDCNTDRLSTVAPTGSRTSCMSTRGAFDMVGNLLEWVADWVPASTTCPGWGGFSSDIMCLSGASTTAPGPGALLRGGVFSLPGAGPLMVLGYIAPSYSNEFVGFRCAR